MRNLDYILYTSPADGAQAWATVDTDAKTVLALTADPHLGLCEHNNAVGGCLPCAVFQGDHDFNRFLDELEFCGRVTVGEYASRPLPVITGWRS